MAILCAPAVILPLFRLSPTRVSAPAIGQFTARITGTTAPWTRTFSVPKLQAFRLEN